MKGGVPTQRFGYSWKMQALFVLSNALTDNMATSTYTNQNELIQALQELHISEVLRFDDYRALNKVIMNEGWQIPNIKEMLQRI